MPRAPIPWSGVEKPFRFAYPTRNGAFGAASAACVADFAASMISWLRWLPNKVRPTPGSRQLWASKDGVSGPLKPRFLDGGITGRAVDVVRRLRRERSDDQDDVAEGLRERRGPAVGRPTGLADPGPKRRGPGGGADRLRDLPDLGRRRGILVVGRRTVRHHHVR